MFEPDCVMIFSGIIMAIGLGFFVGMGIIQIVDYPYGHKLNKGYMITIVVALIVSIISLLIFVKSCKIYYSPELSYERLVKSIDKAEKGLKKFYIDHPEFKENEE